VVRSHREGPLIPRTARCRPPLDCLPPRSDQAIMRLTNTERGDTGNCPPSVAVKHTNRSPPADNEEQASTQAARRDCQKVLHKKHAKRPLPQAVICPPRKVLFFRKIIALFGVPGIKLALLGRTVGAGVLLRGAIASPP